MNNSAFAPFGATYQIGTSPVQVTNNNNNNSTAYRVRNLLSTQQYLSWAPPLPLPAGAPTVTVTAPGAGTPSTNTLGFLPNSVEIIGGLPPNAWFAASSAAAFEITGGEGL